MSPHCFILNEEFSCRLELAYFAGKISKNKLVCENAVAFAYCASCRLLVMGSWYGKSVLANLPEANYITTMLNLQKNVPFTVYNFFLLCITHGLFGAVMILKSCYTKHSKTKLVWCAVEINQEGTIGMRLRSLFIPRISMGVYCIAIHLQVCGFHLW